MLENDTWQVPTLSIYKVPIYKIFKEEFWMNSFSLYQNRPRKDGLKMQFQVPQILILNKKNFLIGYKTTREMNSFGINFMAGTDTPLGYLTPVLVYIKNLNC